jgi:hypothetical protein
LPTWAARRQAYRSSKARENVTHHQKAKEQTDLLAPKL